MKRIITTLSIGILAGSPLLAANDKAIDSALEAILSRLEAGVQGQKFAERDFRELHAALHPGLQQRQGTGRTADAGHLDAREVGQPGHHSVRLGDHSG